MTKQQLIAAAMLLGEIEEKARQALENLRQPDGDYYTNRVAELTEKIQEAAEEGAGLLKLSSAAPQDERKGRGYSPGTGKKAGASAAAVPRRLSRPRVSKAPPPNRSRER